VVPSFRCTFLPDMPSSPTPGSSTSRRPSLRCRHGLRHGLTGSTLPILPQDSFRAGAQFRGFADSQLLRPIRLLASQDESDRNTPSANGGFYVQASDGSVTLPAAGYDYDIDWTPMSAGLAPAGIAASFAALARMSAAICGKPRPGYRFAHPGHVRSVRLGTPTAPSTKGIADLFAPESNIYSTT